MIMKTGVRLALAAGAFVAQMTPAGAELAPAFSVWDILLGEPVSALPAADFATIACGTNGGPASTALADFSEWQKCTPEPSGLREIQFTYDDEQAYVARALEAEYEVLKNGTSVFAHPAVLSVLVDDAGLAQGIRIVTDNRVSDRVRRTAVALARNFKARFEAWGLSCADLPPTDGEMPVGTQFTHELCTATAPEGPATAIRLEASYLRKKGQMAVNTETQQVNRGYFESVTRFEMVRAPYQPSEAP